MMGKPKIRFKGYNEDWEQRKLGEVCQVTMGQSPNGSTYSEVPSDYILVQGNADLKDGWVEPRIWTTQKTKTAQAGDLIMSVRAPAGAMGKTAYDVVLGRGVAGIKGNEFVYQSLVKMDSDGYWKKMAAGSTFESINSDVVKNAEMPVPRDIEEQEKIGLYFIRLDHLITLHHRECIILRKTKVNDWEQRKFTELYRKVNEKNTFRFGVDKIISVANMYFKEDVKKPNDEYMRTYNIMRLGDIAFEGNKSKNFSHGRFVENTIGDGIVSHVFDVFRPVMDYDLLFWKYLINNENVMGRIMTRCTKASTMMTNLVAKDFLNENILVPTIEEQHKIGTYIDKLDHLITLHQHKCDELQNLKKYMLQNMFV